MRPLPIRPYTPPCGLPRCSRHAKNVGIDYTWYECLGPTPMSAHVVSVQLSSSFPGNAKPFVTDPRPLGASQSMMMMMQPLLARRALSSRMMTKLSSSSASNVIIKTPYRRTESSLPPLYKVRGACTAWHIHGASLQSPWCAVVGSQDDAMVGPRKCYRSQYCFMKTCRVWYVLSVRTFTGKMQIMSSMAVPRGLSWIAMMELTLQCYRIALLCMDIPLWPHARLT